MKRMDRAPDLVVTMFYPVADISPLDPKGLVLGGEMEGMHPYDSFPCVDTPDVPGLVILLDGLVHKVGSAWRDRMPPWSTTCMTSFEVTPSG